MIRRTRTPVLLLAIAAMTAGFGASLMMDHGPPVVNVRLGDPIDAVVRRSTYPVSPADTSAASPVAVTEPAVLVYADPEHGFRLPPGKFIWMDLESHRVVGLAASPHLDALPWLSAVARVEEINRRLAAAGWRRAAQPADDSLTALGRRMDAPGEPRSHKNAVAAWSSGDDRAWITIARQGGTGQPSRAARFVVTIDIENPPLARRYGPR